MGLSSFNKHLKPCPPKTDKPIDDGNYDDGNKSDSHPNQQEQEVRRKDDTFAHLHVMFIPIYYSQSALYIAQYVLNTHAHPQKLIEKMKTPWRIQLPLYSEILRTTKVERKDVCIMHVLTTILDLNADRSSYSVLQLENYNRIRQVVGIANLKLECIESFENLDQACIEAFVALIEMFETKHLLCESERIAATLQFLSAAHSDPANYANIICTVTGVSKSVEKEKPVKTVTTDWTEMPDMSFATLLMACEYSHSLIKAKTWAQIAQHGLANLYALAVDGYEDQYTETNSSNYTEPSEEEEEDDRV